MTCDTQGTIYCACWGGRYNVRMAGKWIGPGKLPSVSGKPQIGFVEPAGGDGFAYIAWEEGDKGDPDVGMESGSLIVVGRLLPDGTVAGL